MERNLLLEKLKNLVQLDLDAVEAYQEALEKITDATIHSKISDFRNDHLRHVDNLSKIISDMGEEPPERKKDLKGFLLKGFTALRSVTGMTGALKAMETNELLTNKTYEEALRHEMPVEIKNVIVANYEDERRHLAYIQNVLKTIKL